MIIVDGSLGEQAVLIQSIVILIIEFHIGDGGSLEVHHQGELKFVLLIGGNTAVTVVQVTHQLYRVLGIVGKVIIHSIELNFHIGRINGAAVTVGLADIRIHGLKNDLTGGIIGNADLNTLSASEQAGPDKPQGVDSTFLIGQGDVIPVGRDHHIVRILQEVVGTQVGNIVLRHTADGTGGIGICHDLIFDGDGIIQLVGMGIVVIQVKQRRNGPVTVVGQVGYAHIDVGALGCGQGQETFHIHAVFEGGIQVGLVIFAQGDRHADICGRACLHGDLGALGFFSVHRVDGHNCFAEQVSLFRNSGLTGIGLGLTDTFCKDIGAQVIAQVLLTKVIDGEGHFIDTGAVRIIAKLQLGFVHGFTVFVISNNVCGGVHAVGQVGQAGALLSDSIRQTVGIQNNIGSGHHQPIDHSVHLDLIVGNIGEVFYHILPQQHNRASQVGAGHGSTGQTVIGATGDGGQDITAVGRDLRLDLQAGRRAPGGKVGHERTGSLLPADFQGAGALLRQHLAIILRDGANSQLGIAYIHFNIAGYIIVNDHTGSALCFRDQRFFLKGIVTAAHQRDLAIHIQTGIVGTAANTGDQHIFKFLFLFVTQQSLAEVQLLCRAVICLVEVDNGIPEHQVGGFYTIDGSNGQYAVISAGGADRAGIRIRGQTQVAVLFRAVSGGIAVGGSNHNADACFTDLIVNTAEFLFIRLPAEAAGGTQGHVDHINTKHHTVFQRGQDPCAAGGIHHVGEDFHAHQLRIGCHAGNGIVFTHNDTGNMGAMVVVGGVDIGVIVRIVVAKGHLLVDIDIIDADATAQFIGLGLRQNCRHILIGQAQIVRSKVIQRKGAVIGVQTRIQNRHYHAGAVIGDLSAIKNTGLIDIHGILHQLSLGGLIDFAYDRVFPGPQHLAGCRKIICPDHQFKAGQKSLILLAGGIGNTLLVQSAENLLLAGADPAAQLRSFLGLACVLAKAHSLVRTRIGIH